MAALKRCPICGYQGNVKRQAPGSIGLELVLWVLIFPVGILYSLWRVFNKHAYCPACGNPNLIDANKYPFVDPRRPAPHQHGFATSDALKAILGSFVGLALVYVLAYSWLSLG